MFVQMYHERYMRFPEGREKAFTLSYDDGVESDVKLMRIMHKYGLKGTFNLNSSLFGVREWHGRMTEEQTVSLFKDSGQEVAIHGARHIFLDKAPLPLAVKEIADNRAYLEEKFGCIVRGMAYAYNGYNDRIICALKALGVEYARTTVPTYSFALPSDWLTLNPTCHHADPHLCELADRFLEKKPSDEFKHREPWLMYIWGHSYEYEERGNWQIIESLGSRLCGREDIWFATNGDICDYVKCYESLVYSIDGERVYNPSHRAVWLELRGRAYKIESGQTLLFDK